MNKDERLAQVRRSATDLHDAITMLLSACADMANGNGVLLSVRQFDMAADYILSYLQLEKQARTHLDELRMLLDEIRNANPDLEGMPAWQAAIESGAIP